MYLHKDLGRRTRKIIEERMVKVATTKEKKSRVFFLNLQKRVRMKHINYLYGIKLEKNNKMRENSLVLTYDAKHNPFGL